MVIIPTHRWQVLAFAAASGAFGVSGLMAARRDPSRFRRVASSLGASYFLAQAVKLGMLALRAEAIVVGREGLIDHVGMPPAGFIPWAAIAGVDAVALPMLFVVRKFLGIRLNLADPTRGGRRRFWLEPPMLIGYAALIPEYVLEPRVEEAADTIRYYLDDPDERAELGSLVEAPGGMLW